MLGLDYVSEFTFHQGKVPYSERFHYLLWHNPNSLEEALLQRIQSNVQIAGYFRNQFGEFISITEESLDCGYETGRRLHSKRRCVFIFDNALGQVYTDICLKYNKPKKQKSKRRSV